MRAVGVTLLVLLPLAATVPAQEPTKNDLLLAIEKQLKTANDTTGPAVACVVVSRSDQYGQSPSADQPGKLGAFDPKEFVKANPTESAAKLAPSLDLSDPKNIPDYGYSCGVVIDPNGLILTPYHVVEGATKIYVYLKGGSGSYADIHAADARSDLAVLKLITPPPLLQAIKFGEVRIAEKPKEQGTVFR